MPEALVPTTDGRLVDPSWMRLAEIIHDYDPWLELRWIPPEMRTRDDKEPYCIVDSRPPGEYIVLHAKETDTPSDILTRLFMADGKQGNVLERMDTRNRAIEILEKKKQMEKNEEASDFAAFLMKTPKNFIDEVNPVTGELLHLDDQLRRRR